VTTSPKDPWRLEEDPHALAAKKRQVRAILIAVPVLLAVAAAAWWFTPTQQAPACVQDAKLYAARASTDTNATAQLADATLAQTYLMLQAMGQTCELVAEAQRV
jgi:hypothetical protein